MNESTTTRRAVLGSALASVALVGCGAAGPHPATRRAPTPPPSPEAAAPEEPALFELRLSRWLELHHILCEQGREATDAEAWVAPGLDAVDRRGLTPDQTLRWGTAVAFYGAHFAKKDPIFDPELAALHRALSARASAAGWGSGGDVPPDVARHLDAAMPVYEAHWRALHEAANRRFIEALEPLLRDHGATIASELASALQAPWPRDPLVVDVSAFTNWAGAYSTLGPTRIYIASLDPRNQGVAGLEVLFHEAAHALIRPVRDAISRAAEELGRVPKDLWHVVLFVTAGEIVRRRFPGYVPYGEEHGLYEKGPWKVFHGVVKAHFLPYLERRAELAPAVHDMVAALPG